MREITLEVLFIYLFLVLTVFVYLSYQGNTVFIKRLGKVSFSIFWKGLVLIL